MCFKSTPLVTFFLKSRKNRHLGTASCHSGLGKVIYKQELLPSLLGEARLVHLITQKTLASGFACWSSIFMPMAVMAAPKDSFGGRTDRASWEPSRACQYCQTLPANRALTSWRPLTFLPFLRQSWEEGSPDHRPQKQESNTTCSGVISPTSHEAEHQNTVFISTPKQVEFPEGSFHTS